MNGLEISLLVVVLVGGPLLVRNWWRSWHRQYEAARHTYRAAELDPPGQDFYGSMQRDEERAWQVHHEWERREEKRETDWLTATRAELSPEALDPGPGDSPLVAPGPVERLCGPEQPHEKPAGTESAGSGRRVRTPGGMLLEYDWSGAYEIIETAPGHPLRAERERLVQPADIDAAHTTHPHPGDGWLDGQLAEFYTWLRSQLVAA